MLGDAIDLICLEHAEMEKALKEIRSITCIQGITGSDMLNIVIKCRDKIKRRKETK
jgi:hypothetical protein